MDRLRIIQKALPRLTRAFSLIHTQTTTIPSTNDPTAKLRTTLECYDQIPLAKLNKEIREYWKQAKTNSTFVEGSQPSAFFFRYPDAKIPEYKTFVYQNSGTYRSFVRWEIIRFAAKDSSDVDLQLSKAWETFFNVSPKHNSISLLKFLVFEAIEFQDLTNAIDIYIWYFRQSTNQDPDYSIATKLLTAIAFSAPNQKGTELVKFLELIQFLRTNKPNFHITETTAVQICNKAMSLQDKTTITKKVLDTALGIEHEQNNTIRNSQVHASYKLISQDYAKNNPAGVWYNWLSIKDHYTTLMKHDSRIIYKIIRIFTKQRAYRPKCKTLIEKMNPEDYINNGILLHAVISFASSTKNLKLASDILKQMALNDDPKTERYVFTSRLTLSALLRLHLTFRDSTGVERVLKQINSTHKSLTASDYQSIVDHLLKSGKEKDITKAIIMTQNMKGKACLPSIATIVHHLANFPVNKKPFTTINIRALSQNILAKASIADPEHKSKLWDIVAAIFVRSLTTYNTKTKSRSTAIQITSNDRSRTVKQSQQPVDFLKFCYLNSLKHHNLQITPDPFNAPDPKSVLLKLAYSEQ